MIGPIPVGGPPGVVLIDAGDEPSLIINLDQNNTIYIMENYGDQPGGSKALPLGPGGTAGVTGKKTIYGSCLAGQTAMVGILASGLNFFNSVINALTGNLIATSVHSPNFLTGVSGWSINKSGSAEFNNIIIRNGQVISGTFLLYSTAIPAKGKLVMAFAPIAGGTDLVGNVYPQGYNFGVWDATGALKQHLGIDNNGKLYLADTTGTVRMFADPAIGAISGYDPTGMVAGHMLVSMAANVGLNPAGDTVQRGLTAYGSTSLYSQLDAAILKFFDTVNAATSPAILSLTSITNTNDALALQSPINAGSDLQASLFLQRAATPGPGHAIIGNADLQLGDTSPARPAGGVSFHSATGMPKARTSADGVDYALGHFTTFRTTDQLINSLVFADTCGGNISVSANGTYRVHAELTVVQGPNAAANDFRLGFTGTISQVRIKAKFCQLSATGESEFISATTSNNGLLATPAFAATASYSVTLHGVIVPTSTGTLSIQAAMSAAADTFTVLALSDFHVEQIG